MRTSRLPSALLVATLGAALAAGCGGASTSGPGPLASITVTLTPAGVVVGGTATASASLRDAGGAVITGATPVWTSSAPGVATVSAAGLVTAVSPGSAVITATSNGIAGAATMVVFAGGTVAGQMTALSALVQTAAPSAAVLQAPVILVTDPSGRSPVAGVPVVFSVTAGGGSVTGGSVVTGSDGVAQPTAWIFGPAGPQALTATSSALPGVSVDFAGTSRPASAAFDITLRFLTPMTPTQERAFVDAKERIQQVVVGDVAPQFVSVAASSTCGNVALSETVDDILILVEVGPKDGTGNVLAEAGPCWIWNRTSGFFVVGHMLLDVADVPTLVANGTLETVVLHEMLHVLGFGTLWDDPSLNTNLLVNAGTADPYFQGAQARNYMATMNNGAVYTGIPVPVEDQGVVGDGTRDSHWRESVFDHEIMTGFIDRNSNPLSATTVGSLQDLGYVVDVTKADPFDLAHPAALLGNALQEEGVTFRIGPDVRRERPIHLDADGRPLAP